MHLSNSGTNRRLKIEAAYLVVQRIFEAAGLPPEDAAIVADNLVQADLRGHS